MLNLYTNKKKRKNNKMGYILKNTSGMVNTRFTDAARQKLSQGNFNIRYFQVGDSEV